MRTVTEAAALLEKGSGPPATAGHWAELQRYCRAELAQVENANSKSAAGTRMHQRVLG